ncbi:MAG: AAA family ATPase [Candidatus Diapherotrites archaeon]
MIFLKQATSAFSRKESVLRVQDPDPSHVGRNIVTLDRQTKELLDVTSGDIVEIEGSKKTAAVIWPARQEDEGRGIIRMDNLTRHNCGTNLGEKVTVRKAEYTEAKRIVLAPTQEVRIVASGYEIILKKNFIGRPLVKGDNVWISVFGSGFVYTVVETAPLGTVKIVDSTKFILKETPVKDSAEGISRVAYEDIGGLEEQVKKVREIIELPMRHPEIFRRLGIAPPKGVLLHGPPGTGKTLLAKAVANETQAYFIPVNAPELMCVGGETRILTNPGGDKTAEILFDECLQSGKVINDGNLKILELSNPVKVFGLNENLKIQKGEITHITKLKAKTLHIKTQLGDEVTVSANQPFAVLDAFGNLSWRTAGELKEGDFVAIARVLPESGPEQFDLSKWVDLSEQVMTPKGKMPLEKAVNGQLPVCMKDSWERCNNRSFVKIPNRPSQELMHLLGLMYSEGCLSNDGLIFANHEKALLQEFDRLCQHVFGAPAVVKKTKAVFYSATARNFFEKVLGFPKGRKGDYGLPSWYFRLSKEQTLRFLQGFWEGDGTSGKGVSGYPTIRIYAKHKRILFDLSVLGKKIGLISRITPWNTPYGLMHALVLAGNESREIFAVKLNSKAAKFQVIRNWFEKRIKKGDDLHWPNISPLLKKIKNEKNLTYGKDLPEGPAERYISGRDPLTRRKLLEISELMGNPNELTKLADSDIAWVRIDSIKSGGEKELFDFTVQPFNNFLAGHSLMVLHNSKFVGEAEERIRKVFKDAEKNAPSIIFFDEIDAIAPKRDEVIGEVERRVVAQLLAAMDGMESRGNVVVIAATNRVNSLDEALRRPGRFDREIEIGVPDKKGRKDIMQIHTRGMPLAKDVELDFFASITHGFVGADLAALAKEAAMKALRRYLPKIDLEEETIPQEVLEALEVNKNDFLSALKEIQPSGLREVAIEVPNVKWSDIGGLKKVKDELKQAVEWPLKNPDSFKKMGIKPPKGILLFGPSGTGKTLLAKAVATESEANFISVKGPELISMWAGESLPFDEELLVFDGKMIFKEKIGEIVENKKDLLVITFDSDGKVLFSRINDHIKHSLDGKMLEVLTKTGRKIRVTEKHSLFSYYDGIISVPTSMLVAGESVIAIPARIPNIDLKVERINLFDFFSQKEGFMVKNVSKELRGAVKLIGHENVAEIIGVSEKYLYDVWGKNVSVEAKKFLRLIDESKLTPDLNAMKIGIKGARHYMPAALELNEGLMELLGLWVAEGDYNRGFIRFTIVNEEIKARVRALLSGLKLPFSIFESSTYVNSSIFGSVFRDVLGLESGAFKKRIPKMLLGASTQKAHAFLRGYFSGDGTISSNGRTYLIEASTVSEKLADDLLLLLLKLGIVARHRLKKEWTGSVSHRIVIHGVQNFKRFKGAGFIDVKRNSCIEKYISEKKFYRTNSVPITPKVRELLNAAFGSYPQNKAVELGTLARALQVVDSSRNRGELWAVAEADIYWDKVVAIKEIPYDGFVYDVSVEPCQNFVGGFGGIFAHNSERGIRKVFKRAKQVSPVVVFFDEIDSIASSRGNTLDSGVGDRVVNQLLTELDGVEALKDVVFIAATNRPDLIDSALLRPGRIDKLIQVPPPDEDARESIFKVHTKNVPLDASVSLKELARKTEGYSGADIEGLVREAVLIALAENKLKPTKVSKEHFDEAMKKVLPSISKDVTDAYEQFHSSAHQQPFKPSYVR